MPELLTSIQKHMRAIQKVSNCKAGSGDVDRRSNLMIPPSQGCSDHEEVENR